MTNACSLSKAAGNAGHATRHMGALRRRRKKELLNTLGEAMAIFGLATCFLLCAILMSCLS